MMHGINTYIELLQDKRKLLQVVIAFPHSKIARGESEKAQTG